MGTGTLTHVVPLTGYTVRSAQDAVRVRFLVCGPYGEKYVLRGFQKGTEGYNITRVVVRCQEKTA